MLRALHTIMHHSKLFIQLKKKIMKQTINHKMFILKNFLVGDKLTCLENFQQRTLRKIWTSNSIVNNLHKHKLIIEKDDSIFLNIFNIIYVPLLICMLNV